VAEISPEAVNTIAKSKFVERLMTAIHCAEKDLTMDTPYEKLLNETLLYLQGHDNIELFKLQSAKTRSTNGYASRKRRRD
jgi:hypothetical protein